MANAVINVPVTVHRVTCCGLFGCCSQPKNVNPHFWYGVGFTKEFEKIASLYKLFFGVEHMEALLTILDFPDVPLVLNEVLNNVESQITRYAIWSILLLAVSCNSSRHLLAVHSALAEYSQALQKGLQPMKLQRQLGVLGAYGYFDIKLQYVKGYGPLR